MKCTASEQILRFLGIREGVCQPSWHSREIDNYMGIYQLWESNGFFYIRPLGVRPYSPLNHYHFSFTHLLVLTTIFLLLEELLVPFRERFLINSGMISLDSTFGLSQHILNHSYGSSYACNLCYIWANTAWVTINRNGQKLNLSYIVKLLNCYSIYLYVDQMSFSLQ